MAKFIIKWDAGYGESAEVVDAENIEKAQKLAYEYWKEDVENNANYSAEEYSKELAYELSIEDED